MTWGKVRGGCDISGQNGGPSLLMTVHAPGPDLRFEVGSFFRLCVAEGGTLF